MTHSLPTRRSSDLPEGAAHIFVGAVVHRTMPGKLSADRRIDRTFIGHEISFAARVCYEDRAQCLRVHLGNVKGAHFAIALDQCEHGLLFADRLSPLGVLGFSAALSFRVFDNLILTLDGAALLFNPSFSHSIQHNTNSLTISSHS